MKDIIKLRDSGRLHTVPGPLEGALRADLAEHDREMVLSLLGSCLGFFS